jgi:hypothetical protein
MYILQPVTNNSFQVEETQGFNILLPYEIKLDIIFSMKCDLEMSCERRSSAAIT